MIIIIPIVGIYALGDFKFINWIASALYFLSFGLFISKDVFGNSSLMKKTHGIKIVDNKTGNDVTPMRTVLRNSTLILLLHVEFFWAFMSPKRRIGDYLFNTKLISTDRLSFKESWSKIKATKIDSNIILPFVVANIITLISAFLLKLILEAL